MILAKQDSNDGNSIDKRYSLSGKTDDDDKNNNDQ